MKEWGKDDMSAREGLFCLAFVFIFLSPFFLFAVMVRFGPSDLIEKMESKKNHWRYCSRWCHGITWHNETECLHCDARFKYQPRKPGEWVSYEYYPIDDYMETRRLLDYLEADLNKHENEKNN